MKQNSKTHIKNAKSQKLINYCKRILYYYYLSLCPSKLICIATQMTNNQTHESINCDFTKLTPFINNDVPGTARKVASKMTTFYIQNSNVIFSFHNY